MPSQKNAPDDDDVTLREARMGLRLFAHHYFLRISFGRERRHQSRLEAENQVPLPMRPVTYGVTGTLFFLLFGMACFFYVLKATFGINLQSRPSFLHPIYQLIFG